MGLPLRLVRQLSRQEIKALLRSAHKVRLKPRERLIESGATAREVFLIRKGLIRSYVANERGEDITVSFRHEHQVIASPYILLFGEPARTTSEAVEATTVFRIDYDVLQSVVARHPELKDQQRQVLLQLLKQAIQRVESLLLHSPEERYLNFLTEHPGLVNRVHDKYIAHYLGITPVSLSRIRRRLLDRSRDGEGS